MTKGEIKKGSGIDGLLRGCRPDQLDDAKEIEVVREADLGLLTQKYEEFLELELNVDNVVGFTKGITEILSPEMIDVFLQSTIRYENHRIYWENTGDFISKLIQNSYNAGHNEFALNTQTLEIGYLGTRLEGTKERPIRITITRDVGLGCGLYSKNSIFNIQGNAGEYCGWASENSTYNVQGNTERSCGLYSENSTFNIQGNTDDNCGESSKNSTFNIEGNAGFGCGLDAKNSTFRTPNKENLKKMIRDVPKTWEDPKTKEVDLSGNRVVFISPDGTEEVMRDYDASTD